MSFSKAGQISDNPLPSTDSPRVWVRRLQRYYQAALTSWRSFRFTSFPSFRDTMCVYDLSFVPSSRTRKTVGFGHPVPVPGSTWKRQDLSSSRESSIIRSHSFSDSVPGAVPDHNGTSPVAPASWTTDTRKISTISEFYHEAFGLAVYASQHRIRCRMISHPMMVTHPHAKLASGGWSGLTTQAHPARIRQKAFFMMTLHDFPPLLRTS